MNRLFWMEYRKLFNRFVRFTLAALCCYSFLHSMVYLNLQWRTLDPDGQIVSGLPAYRVLEENARDLSGVIDDDYLRKLVPLYNASVEKEYLRQHRGFLGTGGMTRFDAPNYFINYAYYGPYMSNGNDKINLDYDFLDSADAFYQKYLQAQKEELLYSVGHWPGIGTSAAAQEAFIDRKIARQQFPVTVSSYQGIANLRTYLFLQYPYFLMALGLMLSCVFARDSASGVTELTLSSLHGRRRDMTLRLAAANLFTLTVYGIFAGFLALLHGMVATFSGWNSSVQTFYYHCLHNMTLGNAMTLFFLDGAMGALVVGNLALLFSMLTRNAKAASALSVGTVLLLRRFAAGYGKIRFFLPLSFLSDALVQDYVFIGGFGIPYFAVAPVLALLYVALLTALTLLGRKRYRIC